MPPLQITVRTPPYTAHTEDVEGEPCVVHTITLVDGDDAVYCTQACIDERVQEMATICAVPTAAGAERSSLKKVNMKLVIHIGQNCSDSAVSAYEDYAKSVKDMYNIEVEIEP